LLPNPLLLQNSLPPPLPSMSLNASIVEDAALAMPKAALTRPLPRGEERELGYAVGHGPELAPGEPAAESACALHADRRDSFGEVVQFRFAQTLTRPLPGREERREAIRRQKLASSAGWTASKLEANA
jgi:hypothetical protein